MRAVRHPFTPCALAAGLLAAGSTAALAQGSVVLAGIADAAARHVSNEGQGSVKSLVSGSNSTSRLVFRGTEDLGRGWSAGFHLEHGILFDVGAATQATQFWDRRATVSLASSAAGELRLGRDFVPSYVAWSRFDPFSYVGVAGSNNLVSATPNGPIRTAFSTSPNTTVRSSNAIQWFAPGGWGGVEANVLLAAGEGGAAANGQHKAVGGRVGYAGGPVVVSVAHTRSENNLTGGARFKDSTVGGSVVLGPVRASAAWRRFEQGSAEQTNMMAAAVVTVGSIDFKASVLKADLAGRVGAVAIDGNDAMQYGAGVVYNLSKRSAVYATAARIANDGAATFVVPGGAAVTAGGRKSTGLEAGIRHIF